VRQPDQLYLKQQRVAAAVIMSISGLNGLKCSVQPMAVRAGGGCSNSVARFRSMSSVFLVTTNTKPGTHCASRSVATVQIVLSDANH
jgi:hypothetical protein